MELHFALGAGNELKYIEDCILEPFATPMLGVHMAILLRESEVERLASTNMAVDAIEQAFKLQGQQNADIAPRRRCHLDHGLLHVMSASLPTLGYAGLKSYASVSGVARFTVLLYQGDGQLIAVIEADKLGQLRTGAASAVATKFMARAESSRLGLFGTGLQARSQLQSICAVRPIKTVMAYSRNPEKREKFCREMTELTGIGVHPAATPEEAVKDMDIVVTATTSKEPVFKGEWLSKGTHINAIGANFLSRQEIDVEAVRKSACVVVDSCEQAMIESGDLECATKADAFYWEDARELGLVVVGEFPGREDASEITLFESQGIALEDVALAARIYEQAVKEGIGEPLPF
jgi:ornithine cyclodeaminase/alanine dehydrogenase-like protein (mu-crystallin family)